MKTVLRTWMSRRSLLHVCGSAGLAVLMTSCSARGNVELLESQLRNQESVIRRYETQISELKTDLQVTRRELDQIRSSFSADPQTVALEEVSSNLARIETLVFNTYLTGAQDQDGIAGDEQFFALFYPVDAQGSSVKVRGQIDFEAIDPAQSADQRTIGKWSFSPDESLSLWHSGFLASGFQLTQKWNREPIGSQMLLFARFTTSDGRKFEASHVINITKSSVAFKNERDARTASSAPEMPTRDIPVEDPPAMDKFVPNPEPWEFETRSPSTMPAPAKPKLNYDEIPLPPQHINLNERDGFQTSDNWSEADIPTLR